MIQPYGKNILIQKIDEEDQKGGLLLVLNKNNDPYKAFVIAKGYKVEEDIRIGDVIIVMPYSGLKLEDCGKEYILIKEDEILGEYLDK